MNLQIQCPECSKRFTIHEDLSGKTVECGFCNHRFPVKRETIIEGRSSSFPKGDNQDDFLNRLARPPASNAGSSKAGSPESEHLPQVDDIMPASAAQNIATGAGAALLLLYGLFFLVGTGKGGVFQDVTMTKRIILASFVGVVGFTLMVYGAKRWRGPAVGLALLLVGGLAALTAFRPVLKTPSVTAVPIVSREREEESGSGAELTEDRIKLRVGYEAVERKLQTLEEKFGPNASDYLIAIYIEDLGINQFYNLERYFTRAFDIPEDEAVNRYKRNNEKDSLLVISGVKIDFDEAVRQCEPRLGRATTYPELRLIDLDLSAIHSTEVSEDLREKLSNPQHRSFFATNLKELTALSPERVKEAVRALATVPEGLELQYQEEILIEFMRLLRTENDPELLENLARAFRRWGAGHPVGLTAVSQQVEAWLAEGKKKIFPGYLEYLIENKDPEGLAFVDQLWTEEPESWSRLYALVGANAEPRVLEHLENSPMRLKLGAAGILATIGTERALPALSKHVDSPNEELRILVERAIEAIKGRSG